MIDERLRPNVNDRPELATPDQILPEQAGQQDQQSEADASTLSKPRGTPGRKPLFRR